MSDSQTATAMVSRENGRLSAERLPDVVFWCFLVSGGTSLILEGTLTRLLRFVLGNTTLAITTVLRAFMAGLGRFIGSVYAANTVGAIVGSAVGSFVLIPAWGTHTAIETQLSFYRQGKAYRLAGK